MHDYNSDNTHLWPGIPHSFLYAPIGTPYDPDNPPVIKGDGFPYIQQGHLTLARREIPMTNLQYQILMMAIERLNGSGIIKLRYDMGNGMVESVLFKEIWIKLNPYNNATTHILKKITLRLRWISVLQPLIIWFYELYSRDFTCDMRSIKKAVGKRLMSMKSYVEFNSTGYPGKFWFCRNWTGKPSRNIRIWWCRSENLVMHTRRLAVSPFLH